MYVNLLENSILLINHFKVNYIFFLYKFLCSLYCFSIYYFYNEFFFIEELSEKYFLRDFFEIQL